ncbi:MAG: hypothetical protein JNK51_02400 [Blastocatellia bacterium]|nr:hypothetical protein [Blastocatellia bacterium]
MEARSGQKTRKTNPSGIIEPLVMSYSAAIRCHEKPKTNRPIKSSNAIVKTTQHKPIATRASRPLAPIQPIKDRVTKNMIAAPLKTAI